MRLPPLIRACHVQPTIAVSAYTTAIALGSGQRWKALSTGAAVLAGQLTVGWSNDYIDRDRDRAAGRTDKPIATGEVSAESVRTAAVVAAAACMPLSLLSGWRAASVHGAAVSAALAYNIRLKGTVASVVPYAVAFGALPAFVTLGGPERRLPSRAAMLAASLMGAGAHFINTLPDLEADALTEVRGLPQRLGSARSLIAGIGLMGGATAVISRAGEEPLRPISRALSLTAAGAIAGVTAAAAGGRQRLAWTLALCTSAVTVGLYLSRAETLHV
jgi:4-hydroxybenzoate polyprenyltransferase